MSTIQMAVRQYVVDNFLFGRSDVELTSDSSFLGQGIIDSTGVLELVTFLEDKYQIKIYDEELVPANLDSLQGIAKFVESKCGSLAK